MLESEFCKQHKDKKEISFGLFTDVHYADNKVYGDRYCKDSLEKLEQCIEVFTEKHVDFLVCLGDIIDSSDDKSKELKLLNRAVSVVNSSKIQAHYVIGNHDVNGMSKDEFMGECGTVEAKKYYSFSSGQCHFIILDANYKHDGSDCEDEDYDWTDTNIGLDQMKWLENELYMKKDCMVIVFVHQDFDYRLWQENPDPHIVKNAAEVRSILEKYGNVAAVFQGHYHYGDYQQINGIHYFTLRGMVVGEGIGNNAFAVATICDDTIIVEGYGKQEGMELKLKV